MSNPTNPTPLKETAGAQVSSPRIAISGMPLDRQTSELMLRIYLRLRIENQLKFYRSRVREFDANSGFMVSVGALIMAISSAVSALGAAETNAGYALITTLLPAFAALVASFRQLYQWEKQSSLYRDAALGLQQAQL